MTRQFSTARPRVGRAAISALLAASAFTAVTTTASAYDGSGSAYYAYDGGVVRLAPDDSVVPSGPQFSLPSAPSVGLSFNGISQVDVRGLHSNFSEIPPDTSGVVGATQFMEVSNGAYAVYDKATGAQTMLVADGTFWAAAGQPASDGFQHFSNGDSRILFDKPSQRWIIESFGPTLGTIQIAVSNTSDATAGFKSTVFTAFTGGDPIADYPTLAIDNKAIYIGTNNFDRTLSPQFQGTTLNIISRADIFGAGGPTTTSLKQFVTPYPTVDRGFAIQGVNQVGGNDSGKIIAISAFDFGPVRYNINNPGTPGATQTASLNIDLTPYDPNMHAAQPDGTRNIDTLDDRISSTAWEYKGKIYALHTITAVGGLHTEIEYYVIDAATNAVIQKAVIGDANHDYFQGSIAVNNGGQVVIGYNRSGFGADGKVTFLAQAFNPTTGGGGAITAVGPALVLHVSPIDNYHNGSNQSSPAAGRQRWGDYAQVSVDPNDAHNFWAIGEYALGYLPNPATSFSRWGTWISEITVASVPEPATWGLMLVGFGLVGGAMRRKAKAALAV